MKIVQKKSFLIFICSFALFYLFFDNFRSLLPSQIDTIQYWSASQALLSGLNPYDPDILKSLQAAESPSSPLIRMWNPPFILPFIYPLGFFPYLKIRVIWLSLSLASYVGSLYLLSQNKHGSQKYPPLLVIGTALFPPLIECCAYGQFSWILLVAMTFFLLASDYSKKDLKTSNFLSGLSLSATAIKPHLFLIIFLWSILSKKRSEALQFLFGLLAGTSLLLFISIFIRSSIWTEYFTAFSEPPIYFRTPTLGSLLQALSGIHTTWIRLFPLGGTGLGLVLLRYLRPHTFSLLTPAVIFPLSLLVAPYGWIYDQIILLPILIQVCLGKVPNFYCKVLIAAQLIVLFTPQEWGQEKGIIISITYLIVGLKLSLQREPCLSSRV